jgi:hypothetical protein
MSNIENPKSQRYGTKRKACSRQERQGLQQKVLAK